MIFLFLPTCLLCTVPGSTVGNLLLALLRLRPTVKALEKPGLLIPSEYATSLRRDIFENSVRQIGTAPGSFWGFVSSFLNSTTGFFGTY